MNKCFPPKIQNKARCPSAPPLLSIALEELARAIRQEKKTKGLQTGKEKIKWSLFADDIMTY